MLGEALNEGVRYVNDPQLWSLAGVMLGAAILRFGPPRQIKTIEFNSPQGPPVAQKVDDTTYVLVPPRGNLHLMTESNPHGITVTDARHVRVTRHGTVLIETSGAQHRFSTSRKDPHVSLMNLGDLDYEAALATFKKVVDKEKAEKK